MEQGDYFMFRDVYGPFNASIADLIKCLMLAEKAGAVPAIPESWKEKAGKPGAIPENHAVLSGDSMNRCDLECCRGDYSFEFRDSRHLIHITLESVLVSMTAAENQGMVPEAGDQFWLPAGAAYLRNFRSEEKTEEKTEEETAEKEGEQTMISNVTDLAEARRRREEIRMRNRKNAPETPSFRSEPAPVSEFHTRREIALDRITVREAITAVNDFSAPDCEPYSLDDLHDLDKVVTRSFSVDILINSVPVSEHGFSAPACWDAEEGCWLDISCPGCTRFSSPEIPRPLMCLIRQQLPDLTEQEILDEIAAKFALYLIDSAPA